MEPWFLLVAWQTRNLDIGKVPSQTARETLEVIGELVTPKIDLGSIHQGRRQIFNTRKSMNLEE
jgi:hypothetical protein